MNKVYIISDSLKQASYYAEKSKTMYWIYVCNMTQLLGIDINTVIVIYGPMDGVTTYKLYREAKIRGFKNIFRVMDVK